MASSFFAICKKDSAQIRADAKHKNALLFETRQEANKYLRRVKSLRAKHESEIVEVEVIIKRVK